MHKTAREREREKEKEIREAKEVEADAGKKNERCSLLNYSRRGRASVDIPNQMSLLLPVLRLAFHLEL